MRPPRVAALVGLLIVATAAIGCTSDTGGQGSSSASSADAQSTNIPETSPTRTSLQTSAPAALPPTAQTNENAAGSNDGANGAPDAGSADDTSDDPPAVAKAKANPDCSEQSVTDVSDDERVIVLDNGNRYLIADEYQYLTSTWEGDTVYYCDGGPGGRYIVDEDGDSVPVGALDE